MTSNPPPFRPLVSRTLMLVRPGGVDVPVHVAVGAPYRPATGKGLEDQAGCLVLTCDDPDLSVEVSGFDEFEALVSAVSFLQQFLIKITDEMGGRLQTLDGRPVDPVSSAFRRQIQRFTSGWGQS